MRNGFLRFTSDVTPADLLIAIMVVEPFLFDNCTHIQASLEFESGIECTAATHYTTDRHATVFLMSHGGSAMVRKLILISRKFYETGLINERN